MKHIKDAELAAAQYTNRAFAKAQRSAGAALLSLFSAWGIGAGEAVFVPAFVPQYVISSILLCSAVPVVCDVSRETFCMSPKSLKKAVEHVLSERKLEPRLAIVCDYAGLAPQFEQLAKVCNSFGLLLAEECSMGFGGTLKGKPLGSFGDASIVGIERKSFGAGIVFTDNERLFKELDKQSYCEAGGIGAPLPEADSRELSAFIESLPEHLKENTLAAQSIIEKLGAQGCELIKTADDAANAFEYIPFIAPKDLQTEGGKLQGAYFPKPACQSKFLRRTGVKPEEITEAQSVAGRLFVVE